jgi:DeoR/GlpR family transcriptional regulator of sugar metabolism
MWAIDLEGGMTNDYLPEVVTDRTIIEMAAELVLVADHTKFGKVAAAYVAPVERITTLVTDAQTNQMILTRLQQMGVRVVTAN